MRKRLYSIVCAALALAVMLCMMSVPSVAASNNSMKNALTIKVGENFSIDNSSGTSTAAFWYKFTLSESSRVMFYDNGYLPDSISKGNYTFYNPDGTERSSGAMTKLLGRSNTIFSFKEKGTYYLKLSVPKGGAVGKARLCVNKSSGKSVKKSLKVTLGKSYDLTSYVKDFSGSLTWDLTGTSYIGITQTGKLTTKKAGSGKIYVFSSGGDYAELGIEVAADTSGSSSSSNSSSSNYVGKFSTSDVSNGATHNMYVGDSITFYNRRQPTSTLYAYNWFPSDKSFADFDGLASNSPTLKITAKKAGKFTVMATLDYTVMIGSYFNSYNYEDTFTIVISDPPKSSSGSSSSSSNTSSSSSSSGSGAVKISAVSGTAGANSSETYENLCDGSVYTKWCVTNFSSAYAVFELSSAASIKGFKVTTANDNSKYTGRNPAEICVYGSNKSSRPSSGDSSWKLVAYSDPTGMKDVDYTTYQFSLQNETDKYKYYKLEVTKTTGASVMQLSEFQLFSGKYTFTQANTSSSGSSGSSGSTGGSGSTGSIGGITPTPSSTINTKTCSRCKGSGTVTCNSCSGRGYFEERKSTPNYSGKSGGSKYYTVKRDCPVCTNGKRTCTLCGGDGKV